MFNPVEDEDVRRAATCTLLLVRKAVKEEVGAKASAVLVVVAATTASARAERARRSRIMADALVGMDTASSRWAGVLLYSQFGAIETLELQGLQVRSVDRSTDASTFSALLHQLYQVQECVKFYFRECFISLVERVMRLAAAASPPLKLFCNLLCPR